MKKHFTTLREFWFTVRWQWRNRTWNPTRQKDKAFRRDLAKFKAAGVTPWAK